MSPCLSCSVFAKDETGHDKTWPEKWNDTCPECGQKFVQNDRVLIADDAVVYHYDCYQGDKPAFEDALVFLD